MPASGCTCILNYNSENITVNIFNSTCDKQWVQSHFPCMPRAWHLSIISLVGMLGSCHHHHGNVSILLLAITMAMGVSPSNHQHGPNVSLLTKITMAICACPNIELWYVGKCICASLNIETPTGVVSVDAPPSLISSARFLISVQFFSTWNLIIVRRLFYNLPLGLTGIKQLCSPPGPVSEHCRLLTDFCVPSTQDFTIKIVKADKTQGGSGPERSMSPFQQGHGHMARTVSFW